MNRLSVAELKQVFNWVVLLLFGQLGNMCVIHYTFWVNYLTQQLECQTFCEIIICSVLFFIQHRSEGRPHHGHTFFIYLCHSDWLFHSESHPRIDVVHPGSAWSSLACSVHLSLFLSLSLSPGNSLVFSWCDHSMLACLLWQCLTLPVYFSFVKNPLICFLCCPQNWQNLSQHFHLEGMFLHCF